MADKLTTQNAGLKAVAMVREILDSYRLPGQPKLSYSGLRGGKTAQNSSRLQDGVITVNASFRTYSNVSVSFDIPIEINNGELQEPSVIVHDGLARIIAQSTFDNIVERNTISDMLPVRELYSSPMEPDIARDAYANRIKMTRVNKGLFSVHANRENLRRAMRGQTVAQLEDLPDATDDAEWLDQPWAQEDIVGELFDLKTQGYGMEDAINHVIQQGALGSQQPNEMQIGYLQDMWDRISWPMTAPAVDKAASPMGTNPNKPPKPPKTMKAPKMPKAPGLKSKPGKQLCSKCNHQPCVCPNKRKKKSALEVVTGEISRLEGLAKTAQGGELAEIKTLIQQLQQKVTQFEKANPAQKQILDPSGKPAAPSGKTPPPLAPALEKQRQQRSQPAAPATPAPAAPAPAGPASPSQGPACGTAS